MTWRSTFPVLVALCLLGTGCKDGGQKSSSDNRHDHNRQAHGKTDKSGSEPGSSKHSGSQGAGEQKRPMETYHSMDSRKPVPLIPKMAQHQKTNMRDHLQAVEAIIAGAAEGDFEAVSKAADRIGSSPQMRQMCQHMGAGAQGFTPKALEFHKRADKIKTAAKDENLQGVLTHLDQTLNTCNSCHGEYKQKVVTPAVWQKKTGMAAPSGGGGMHHR